MNVTLSKEYGINSCLTICPRCGKDGTDIVLLGNAQEYTCNNCGGKIIGKPPSGECPHCTHLSSYTKVGPVDGSSRKLPSSEICDECKAEIKMLKEEIGKGGVPWKCIDCKSEGVIKHNSDFAIDFRKQYPIEGFSFSKDNCPVCSENTKKRKKRNKSNI